MRRKIIPILLLAIFLAGNIKNGTAKSGFSSTSTVVNPDAQEMSEDPIDLFMPMILKPNRTQSVFGLETFNFTSENLDYADEANNYWVRSPLFSWKDIEPTKGTYNWNSINDQALRNLAGYGFQIIATVKYVPSWAWKVPGYYCGPPSKSALPDFARFMRDLVTKYSAAPYNIRYWEIGNEPDIDPKVVPNIQPDNVYGCWGDNSKNYYGGEYYADMLKVVYPAIKQANPESKVLIGGLLLDCDPNNPPTGKSCKESKFFEGILRNGGAPYFDIVSFHSYVWGGETSIIDENSPNWPNGGQIDGKVNFLRNTMSRYGVNKPLLMTEFAVICNGNGLCDDPSHDFFGLKADGVVSSYVRSIALGLMGEIWYTLEDNTWRHSALFHEGNPTPAYDAMVFLSKELFGASFHSAITQYSGLRGYVFRHPDKEIQILWAPDSSTGKMINVPDGVVKIYDRVGTPIEPIPAQIYIAHPTYFEVAFQ